MPEQYLESEAPQKLNDVQDTYRQQCSAGLLTDFHVHDQDGMPWPELYHHMACMVFL